MAVQKVDSGEPGSGLLACWKLAVSAFGCGMAEPSPNLRSSSHYRLSHILHRQFDGVAHSDQHYVARADICSQIDNFVPLGAFALIAFTETST